MNLVEESSGRREGAAGEPGGKGAGERASPMSGFVGKDINMPAGSSHASVSGVAGVGDGREWGSGVPGGRGAGCLNKQLSENTSAYSLSVQRLQDAGLSGQ